jgi:pullulanase
LNQQPVTLSGLHSHSVFTFSDRLLHDAGRRVQPPRSSCVRVYSHELGDPASPASSEALHTHAHVYTGAFNDRFRDAVLGGSPFSPPTLQGFLTGLSTDPNHRVTPDTPEATLAAYTAWLQLGLAGNLKDFPVTAADGIVQKGQEVMFGQVPAAYCAQPSENVVYLGCHDNETLYDTVVLKTNHLGSAGVCAREVQIALGLIAVAQGVAFFHAGDDLLRSKSLDRDSYDSGDWFNKLLWGGEHNNFGVRLCALSITC